MAKPAGLDLEFTSGERKAPSQPAAASDLDFLLDEPKRGSDEEPTREFDPLSRTQETPTIESPTIDRSSQTMRERRSRQGVLASADRADRRAVARRSRPGRRCARAFRLARRHDFAGEGCDRDEGPAPLRDDEMTQLAPSLGSFDRTMKAPRVEKFDIETHRHDLHRPGRSAPAATPSSSRGRTSTRPRR